MEYSQHTRFGIWKLLPTSVCAAYGLRVLEVKFGILQPQSSGGYLVAITLRLVPVLDPAMRGISRELPFDRRRRRAGQLASVPSL